MWASLLQEPPELSGLMHPRSVLSVTGLPNPLHTQKCVAISFLLMILFVVVDLFLYILLESQEGVKINTLLMLSS